MQQHVHTKQLLRIDQKSDSGKYTPGNANVEIAPETCAIFNPKMVGRFCRISQYYTSSNDPSLATNAGRPSSLSISAIMVGERDSRRTWASLTGLGVGWPSRMVAD